MKHAPIGAVAILVFIHACTVASDDSLEQPVLDEVTADPTDAHPPDDPSIVPGPTITRTFTESSAELVNPERGYYVGYNLRAHRDARPIRDGGRSLAIALVRLDEYRAAPLDAALLADLTSGFAAARAAGIKIVLRFSYNADYSGDAPRARILGHLEQLAPLLAANADVIAVMQAGFIGAYGEWHSSTNGLDNPADRTAILNAILAALPAHRQVQIRTPMFKDAAFPGGPLTEEEAWTTSARARVGHHNDCFLASATDLGTYASPIAQWMSYVATDGRYTAIGGETCAVFPARSACAPALAEMTDKHWSYLNAQYNTLVLDGWVAGGCADEVKRRLGYRFVLDEAIHTEAVAPGGELALTLSITNRGFAAPFNRRPVEIVLSRGTTRLSARLGAADARRWAAGTTTSVAARLRIPATIGPGTYTLAVRLPDESTSLAADPRFAIQLASDGVWDEAHGDNVITTALAIDPAAPGPRDPAANTFEELP